MQKKSKKLPIGIAFILILAVCTVFYLNRFVINRENTITATKNINSLTYAEFNKNTKDLYDNLIKKEYKDAIVAKPGLTIYPGNPEKKWALDNFDAVNNNATQPKKVSIFVMEKELITRIDFVYQPELSGKYYLNVNRIDEKTNTLIGKDLKMPMFYINSFTIKGIFIQITTFSEEQDNSDKKSTEECLIKQNTDITNKIQRYILDHKIE